MLTISITIVKLDIGSFAWIISQHNQTIKSRFKEYLSSSASERFDIFLTIFYNKFFVG
nr:MAG TPA: hypothetical protein [Caudoviricetes sp.]